MAFSFDFRTIFANLEGMGFFEIFLPFLLIFTLIFAILERVQILGQGKTRFNAIIAVILGLLAIRNPDVIGLIHRLLPNISIIIVSIVMVLLLVGIFLGRKYSGLTGGLMGLVVLVSIFLVLLSLGSDQLGVSMPYWLEDFFKNIGLDETGLSSLFIFIVVVVVIAFIIGAAKRGGNKNPLKWIGDGLSEIGSGFGGGSS